MQWRLARVWVRVYEVVVITEVVVSQYSRNLPSRCFASIKIVFGGSLPMLQIILPTSLNPGARLALSSSTPLVIG